MIVSRMPGFSVGFDLPNVVLPVSARGRWLTAGFEPKAKLRAVAFDQEIHTFADTPSCRIIIVRSRSERFEPLPFGKIDEDAISNPKLKSSYS